MLQALTGRQPSERQPPTDATAVGVLARALPRRTVTILRAESLVNDGTALVIYGLAVG